MWKWVIPLTLVVIATGVAIMVVWSAVNHLLAGQGASVNWAETLFALLFIVLASLLFAVFSRRLALVSEPESVTHR